MREFDTNSVNANIGGGWGRGGCYIYENRQQCSSEDAELSAIVCRLNEHHIFITFSERSFFLET